MDPHLGDRLTMCVALASSSRLPDDTLRSRYDMLSPQTVRCFAQPVVSPSGLFRQPIKKETCFYS